ncbi:hypothetical protein BGZ63DRAFT_68705 [Mariannaea sp. PMI_226]|nr:hypothetical protein BGZ63DRAFT_68705 [Mariannaea sp. PMI_226]
MSETAVEVEAPTLLVEAQLPLSESINTQSSSSPAKKPTKDTTGHKKLPFNLASAIAATPSKLDGFIQHLHRCLHTRGGTDTVLLFLAYTARLTGASLDILGRTALRHSARKLVELFFQLPPSTTVVLGTAPAPRLATLAIALSKRLAAFVDMLSEWRTMNRLWGIMAMWLAAKDLLLRLRKPDSASEADDEKTPQAGKFNTTIEVLQVATLTAYHIGEAAAWFTSKGVLKWSPEACNRFSIVSVRSWGAYVFMELLRLLVDRKRRTPSEDPVAEKEYNDEWRTNFLHTLAWAPLTIHWGFGSGFLPEIAIAALATYPSVALMKNLWQKTA